MPQGPKRASGIAANLLWDNVEYALGIGVRGQVDRVVRQHQAFLDAITDRFGQEPDDPGLHALLRFLAGFSPTELEAQPLGPELLASNPFISFRLAGDAELICRRRIVRSTIDSGPTEPDGLCLVTGERAAIARLHPSIKGVRGTNTSGGSLVSFNLESFESYGHAQGSNAPIGTAASFAYTTALNDLLVTRRRTVADSTIVYWAERADAGELEAAFADLIAEPARDDPLAGTHAVAAVLDSVRTGVPLTGDDGSRFFILALAPNAARISVRDARITTIADLARAIKRHHSDLDIVRPPFVAPYSSLSRLLNATAIQGKSENVPPNLTGDVIRAIVDDRPYPMSLLQAAVRRSRVAARERFDPLTFLASVIKASLNCRWRAGETTDMSKELTVALDPDNPNPAYRLGRLFAILERAQEMASGGELNATIRDRFYGAAAATPVTVFSRLLALKNHHRCEIRTTGRPGLDRTDHR